MRKAALSERLTGAEDQRSRPLRTVRILDAAGAASALQEREGQLRERLLEEQAQNERRKLKTRPAASAAGAGQSRAGELRGSREEREREREKMMREDESRAAETAEIADEGARGACGASTNRPKPKVLKLPQEGLMICCTKRRLP